MYAPSIVSDTIIDALAAYMSPFMLGGQVVRGQVNRVPLPPAPCAVLTELRQKDLAVPWSDYDELNAAIDITGPTQIDIQIDIYGEQSSNICRAISTAFRSGWGFDRFPLSIKPLYMSDGIQSPLITGEKQYENRWTITAYLQYNPVTTVPQDSANALALESVIDVDLK